VERLRGRIALITGASRGIGAAVAKRFAAEGAHVILVARTVGALEEVYDAIVAAGGTATGVPLDVADAARIDELAAHIDERYGRLDILVGNAGVLGPLSPLAHVDPPEWERVFAVNLHANWRLIRAMDLLLRRSAAGRAIFVSSGVTRGVHAYWGAYAVSKAALEALVRTYAAEVESFGVKANVVHPGIVRTAMRAQAMPGEDPLSLKPPEAVTDAFVALAEASWTRSGEIVQA
jgi:NAD(P)-dependent dehydrogenase (short-subunit alcohol dehydrogenase family)